MSLTKLEVLDLFVQHVDSTVIAQRIKEMYQMLGPAQRDTAYAIMRGDLVAALTAVRDQIQDQDTSVDAALAAANADIDEVNNAT
jgi:hypothetical protein